MCLVNIFVIDAYLRFVGRTENPTKIGKNGKFVPNDLTCRPIVAKMATWNLMQFGIQTGIHNIYGL